MPAPITITSPFAAEDLLFASMTASAGLGLLGEMQLTLLSPKADLKPEDLLGKPLTVKVRLRNDGQRCFNGIVTRFGIGANHSRYYAYHATVHHWLWFLTRTADCRIFQDLTVPEIVKKVFEDHEMARFEFKLFRSYRKRPYCVQYRETDYNFVARLLEHEGIYWYTEHADGQHKLVLVDSHSAHDAAPQCSELPYIEHGAHTAPDTDCISEWASSREVRSGKVALTSYDFERPSTRLDAKAAVARSHSHADYEVFDFQGDYLQAADGTQLAEDRIDELQAPFLVLQGTSNAQGIEVGRLLTLSRHPRKDQNAQYLVTGISVSAQMDGYESGNPAGAYRCEFTAIPAAQQFRPPRQTPRPFLQGPQTAVVVGPEGDEVFTDKYGRVKVQFHWDRYGKNNEASSCWVRVSQPWAGKNFGAVHIPRIGQEVVVGFLEGDPDQPLVTGSVYNAEQMPPWDLPANATQSGVLTRSSKGGDYTKANAIRFDDKAGAEELWLHAERDQLAEVEHDEKKWVGNDRTKTVDHDETTHIKHDRTETVDNDESITVKGKRTEVVDKEESITIHGGRTEKVGKDESITIDGARTETVAKDEKITIKGGRSEEVAKDESVKVTGARDVHVGKDDTLTVGKHLRIDAGDSITLTTGSASIALKKDGTITIRGKDITLDGSGKINVEAKSNVVLKGAKVLLNG